MYICSKCLTTYPKWQGRCDNCKEWNSLQQSLATIANKKTSKKISSEVKPVKLRDIDEKDGYSKQIKTGIHELDNTLGGRIVSGQVILFAGAPGIGKSTLSLEVAESLSKQGLKIFYIAGEESPRQIKTRADRLGHLLNNVSFYQNTNTNQIESYITSNVNNIDFVFVDSIQTLSSEDINSSAGSISQISDATNKLVSLAKGFNIPIILIGHINKSGDIAGPKVVEHMVDTVIHFEGDKKHTLRMLRVEKNRFGSTDEIGLFLMTSKGLKEVSDPKELFDSSKVDTAGAVYCMALEGSRPIVIEVQALATKSYMSNPRRATSGLELNRLYILLAIIDKKLNLKTYEYDIYINITGGITIKDPALDLAVIAAVISSIKNKPVSRKEIYFGEVGLTGEIRKVIGEEKRTKEATRLGFDKIVSKSKNISDVLQI